MGIGLVGVVMDPWLACGVASLENFFGRFLAVEDLKKGKKESVTLLQWHKRVLQHTVWTFRKIAVTEILCETKFGKSKGSRTFCFGCNLEW